MKYVSILLLTHLLGTLSPAQVIINEILYNAPDDLPLEFVELYHKGDAPIDLGGWKVSDLRKRFRFPDPEHLHGRRPSYQFPSPTVLQPDTYLVLARRPDLFETFYHFMPHGTLMRILGNQADGVVLEDAHGKIIDHVTYRDTAPWPVAADGRSASLERICPDLPANDSNNWAASPSSRDYQRIPGGTPGRENTQRSDELPLPVSISPFPRNVAPGTRITIDATIPNKKVKSVRLGYRFVKPGRLGEEETIAMKVSGENYIAQISASNESCILRFRVIATSATGRDTIVPSPNALRPAHSILVTDPVETGAIPVAEIINVGKIAHAEAAAYREAATTGRRSTRWSEADRQRMSAKTSLHAAMDLAGLWSRLSLEQELPIFLHTQLAPILDGVQAQLSEWFEEIEGHDSPSDYQKELGPLAANLRADLKVQLAEILTPTQLKPYNTSNDAPTESSIALRQLVPVERSWLGTTLMSDITTEQRQALQTVHHDVKKQRDDTAAELAGQRLRLMQQQALELNELLHRQIGKILSEKEILRYQQQRDALNPFGRPQTGRRQKLQGPSAIIITDPETKETELFDFVHITRRSSGYKVRLHKDHRWRDMSSINVLFEPNPRNVFCEPLAYELHRRADVPASWCDFFRLSIDGQLLGYHLAIEQPNKSFLRRNKLDADADLYKVIWQGSHRPSPFAYPDGPPERMDIIGRHEKKTNVHENYEPLTRWLQELAEKGRGASASLINYFAVNTLLSHWDGYHNNYFLYLSSNKGPMIFPYDQDKTWGFHDGIGRNEIFSTMPLTMGMEGDLPPGLAGPANRHAGRIGAPGAPWWRSGGEISKILLANPNGRRRFLSRVRDLANTIFSEKAFGPVIDDLEKRLMPEVRLRAQALGRDEAKAAEEFAHVMGLFREHLRSRRAFILAQDEIKDLN